MSGRWGQGKKGEDREEGEPKEVKAPVARWGMGIWNILGELFSILTAH